MREFREIIILEIFPYLYFIYCFWSARGTACYLAIIDKERKFTEGKKSIKKISQIHKKRFSLSARSSIYEAMIDIALEDNRDSVLKNKSKSSSLISSRIVN